jgi:DNA-binding PadR family transcriptional regulator
MYKQVMLLGLLLERPMYGQQIREVIETHHDILANFMKKPTIYYQLERLVAEGYLEIRRETVEAPGPGAAHDDITLRERDVYYLTEAGRKRFYALLQETLSAYTPGFNGVDACLFFLHHLTEKEAVALLEERSARVVAHRQSVLKQMENYTHFEEAHRLVSDHQLTLLDAELRWLAHTIEHLRNGKRKISHTTG